MEIIGEYLNYLEIDRGLSFNSLRLYKRDLLDFDTFVQNEIVKQNNISIFDIKKLEPRHLEKFCDWIREQGKTTATVNRKLTAVHGLWQWLREQGEVERDPFTQIIRLGQHRNKEPKYLSLEEVNQLLDFHEHDLRTKIVLELIYATGIRIGELTQLTIADIDLENQLITIPRYSRFKERVIPFNRLVKEYMLEYIEEHKLETNEKLLFTLQREKLSEREVFRIIRDAAKAAGLEKKVSSSILRNSFLQHMKENGAHDIFLRDLTGQKNV